MTEEIRCDFDSMPDPVWEYPCRSFTMMTVEKETHRSVEGWLACKGCAALIEEKDYDGLIDRVLTRYYKLNPPAGTNMPHVHATELISLYEKFEVSRLGERIKL